MEATETNQIESPVSDINTDEAYVQLKRPKRSSEIRHNLFVLQSLVSRDFKLKYRRSFLGILWSILNPLLMMIVMAAVFSYMFRFAIENFPLYLILGTVLFDYMNRATSSAVTSIIEAQALIKKVRINKMIFPIQKVTFELVNFAISLVAAIIVMIYFQVWPSIYAIWGLPILVICVTVFSAGLGLLLSALAVYFRDIIYLWSVIITAWTYATPLFYPYDMLLPWMQQVMQFNPMYHYVTYFRDIMMWNINPGGVETLICLGMAVITFIIGFLVFRKAQSKFILYI